VLEIIKERLASDDAKSGFVLDGFPRNKAQARDLTAVLAGSNVQLDCVVLMHVDFEILMKRLTGRRTCSTTGELLNIYFSLQFELDACTESGGELVCRPDDKEETIRNRLEVYERETAPLIEYYRAEGLLQTVQAEAPPGEVYIRLLAALGRGK
jgi:adenylate kinase